MSDQAEIGRRVARATLRWSLATDGTIALRDRMLTALALPFWREQPFARSLPRIYPRTPDTPVPDEPTSG